MAFQDDHPDRPETERDPAEARLDEIVPPQPRSAGDLLQGITWWVLMLLMATVAVIVAIALFSREGEGY